MDYEEIMDGVLISEVAMDDWSPATRECYRASMTRDWRHQEQCPNCLENDTDHLLMEAASHREDGNVEDAQALLARSGLQGHAARRQRRAGASGRLR